MYFVFLIALVTVSARDISLIHNNEPRQERFDRPYANPLDNFNSYYNIPNGFVNTNNHAQLNAPNNRQFVNNDRNNERPFVNPHLERQHSNRQENVNDHDQNGFVNAYNAEQFNMQNNREFIPNNDNKNDRSWNPQANQHNFQDNLNGHEQFNAQRHREFIPNNNNNRNDRNWNPNTNPERPHANFNNNEQSVAHNNRDIISNDNNRYEGANAYPDAHDNAGIMSINLAFDRQGNQNRRDQSNLKIPRQSFNINNEYSNGDDAKRSISRNTNRNDKYNENILHARRQQDEITLGDYNRETQGDHRSNPHPTNIGIVPFLNNLNNTNQNPNRNNPIHQSGLKNTDTAYKPKTAIENEVTQNPLVNGKVEKGNVSPEWVWGVEETTTMSPVTVDDRAAFSGDKCAQGLVRFMGKCVPED